MRFLNILLGSTTMIVFSSCTSTSNYTPVCEILNYGIVSLNLEDRELKDIEDVSNRKLGTFSGAPGISKNTSVIPVKLGRSFGLSHRFTGAPSATKIKLITTHPEISYDGVVSTGGTRFKSLSDKGTIFTFDLPEEMALGNWTFIFEYSGSELCRQEFSVVENNL